MLKRILSILLLSVFTLTAVGVEVKKLYCDGKLSKTGAEAKPCCMKSSCCKVQSDFFALTDHYEASGFSFDFKSLLSAVLFIVPPQLVLEFPPVLSIPSAENPPDPGRLYSSVPLRTLHCSYQI